jgi:hypothetical protein
VGFGGVSHCAAMLLLAKTIMSEHPLSKVIKYLEKAGHEMV